MTKLGEVLLVAVATALTAKVADFLLQRAELSLFWQYFVIGLWPVWLGVLLGGLYWCARDYSTLRRRAAALERQSASLAAADTEIAKRVAAVDERVTGVDKLRRDSAIATLDYLDTFKDLRERVANLEGRLNHVEGQVYDADELDEDDEP